MKKIIQMIRISAFAFSMILISNLVLAQTTVFYDNFETGFPGVKWRQTSVPPGQINWLLASGGPVIIQPPIPQGDYCLRILSSSQGKNELVTAAVDLSSYLSARIEFYRNQPLSGQQTADTLSVLCRQSPTGPWFRLALPFYTTSGWVKTSLTIPQSLFGQKTQICFRGCSVGGGAGLSLDEISIVATGGSIATFKGVVSRDIMNCSNFTNGCPAQSDTLGVDIPTRVYGYSPALFGGSFLRMKNMTLGVNYGYGAGYGYKSTTETIASFDVYGNLVITEDLTIQYPAVLTVRTGGSLTVLGKITIISPNGMGNSVLIVENNGSLITGCDILYLPYNTPPYSGTGYPVIYRTIPQDLKWHFLSSPVVNQQIANKDFAPAPNTFLQVPNTVWDFYKFLTTCPDPPYDEHWRNLRNPDGTQNYIDFGYPSYFQVGKGYLVAYDNWHGSNQVFFNNLTKTFYGPLNACCSEFHFNDEQSQCNSFWELIGNPFTSAIDWGKIEQKSNLATDYYYIYNDNKSGGAGYEFWGDSIHHSSGADGYIPAMQGFFVDVLSNGGRFIGIPLSARVHHNTSDTWLKDTPSNLLTINLSNGTHFDETYVIFESQSDPGIDRKDARKMFTLATEVPQIYSVVDNDQKTAFNSLPVNRFPQTVPLGFVSPNSGNYRIKVTGVENFRGLTGLILEDVQAQTSQNLLLNPEYLFYSEQAEVADRFLLHLSGVIGIGEKTQTDITIYSSDNKIFIRCPEGFKNTSFTLSNLLGQEIISKTLVDQPVNQIHFDALRGYYIVRVQNETTVKTTKVYIQ